MSYSKHYNGSDLDFDKYEPGNGDLTAQNRPHSNIHVTDPCFTFLRGYFVR